VNASVSPDPPITRTADHPIPRIWVDTDIALGAPRGDVDDGFALALLAAVHRQGNIQLLGVSTVFGNATAAISQACARDLLQRAGADVPVVSGAERAGESTPAAERIAEAGGNNIEIVALGPLTNLAAACRRDPGLAGRASLRAVGGNLSSLGFLPPLWPFEFNFARDRKGARFVLSLPWRRLTLFPLDVVRRLAVGAEELDELGKISDLGRYLAGESRRWLQRARWRHFGRRFPLWDVPAALDAARLLDSTIEPRRLAPGARWLLAQPASLSCLTHFDPSAAWEKFLQLVGNAPASPRNKAG
jgi:inosine-uridine nucleoside N-ribohydrolase